MPIASSTASEAHSGVGGHSRILEVDGLRGIAIGLVLFYHYIGASVQAPPRSALAYLLAPSRLAWSGVDLFFVLSGFLIGGILLDAKNATNYFGVFYTRRFFRIVPIYAVLLVAFLVVRFCVSNPSQSAFAWTIADPMPFATYLFFLQNFWMAAAGTFGCHWLGATWSLAVEEQFYLTLPLIVRFLSRRALWTFVFLGIACAPVARILVFHSSPHGWVGGYTLLFCRADALLFGVLCALLLRNSSCRQRISGSSHWFAGVLALLLGILAILTKTNAGMTTRVMASIGYTSLAALYACLLLLVCTHTNSLVARTARWSVLRWLGSVAYGAYLFHEPIQGMLFALVRKSAPKIEDLPSLFLMLLALGLTLMLAHISWNSFEARLVKFSHRAKYKLEQLNDRVVPAPVPAGAPR